MASVRLKQIIMDVKTSLPGAQEAMQRAEKWLLCQEQHQDLKTAVDDVLRILSDELSSERLAAADHSRAESHRALIEGGIDMLMSLFSSEYRIPQRRPPKVPPFGKVFVQVGPEGIPDGLRVFNISRTAREEGTWELTVLNRLVTQGGRLLPPKSFQELVAWLGTEVLEGNITLPYYPQVHNER